MVKYDLAIIGNGYDLYYNQPTRYDDFYNVVKDINDLDYEGFKEKNSCEKDLTIFYEETKCKCDSNFFFKYFIAYNKTYDCWSVFENELLSVLKIFDELLKEIENNNYVYVLNSEGKVGLIISNGTIYEDLLEIVSKCKLYEYERAYIHPGGKLIINVDGNDKNKLYIKNEIKKYINDFPKRLYDDLIEFCDSFADYIELFVNMPKPKKLNLDFGADNVVTYNYTNIAEKLFNPASCCYIHGNLLTDKNIVFGIDSSNEELKRFFYFYKRVQRTVRGTDYNKLDDSIYHRHRVVIIGHSLDEADDDSLKKILIQSTRYAAITVFYYKNDKYAVANLSNNLSRILGKDIYDTLTITKVIRFVPLEE